MGCVCGVLAAVAAAGSARPEDAAADVVVSSALRSACDVWHRDEAVFACDPRGGGRRITLTLGHARVSRHAQHRTVAGGEPAGGASLHIGGDEPVHPGETVRLDWPKPSSQAELAIRIFTSSGVRTVALRLSWRPRRVAVAVRSDSSLEVRSAGRTDIVPAPRSAMPEGVLWQVRSARDAADRVLWAVDHLADRGRRDAVMRTLCAGLHPDTYAFYGLARQLRDIDDPTGGRRSCAEEMWLWLQSIDGTALRSSRYQGQALRIRGRRAVLRTTIVQGLGDDQGASWRETIPARILLSRDREGIWRLASFQALGIAEERGDRPRREQYDDRSLERWFRHQRRIAARSQAAYDRAEAELRAAKVPLQTAPPCSPPWRGDVGGDVRVVGSRDQRARRPSDHLGVDLTAAGFDGRCLGVRTAGPLPPTFRVGMAIGDVEAGDPGEYHIDVDRDDGTAVAMRGTFDDDTVPGMQASVSDQELVVLFPRAIPQQPAPVHLGIETSPLGVRFFDAVAIG